MRCCWWASGSGALPGTDWLSGPGPPKTARLAGDRTQAVLRGETSCWGVRRTQQRAVAGPKPWPRPQYPQGHQWCWPLASLLQTTLRHTSKEPGAARQSRSLVATRLSPEPSHTVCDWPWPSDRDANLPSPQHAGCSRFQKAAFQKPFLRKEKQLVAVTALETL